MIYPDRRPGTPVEILGQEPEFSYFPMRQNRRWGRQPGLYASDVWGVIAGSLGQRCAQDLSSAQSFIRQAREYYSAADRAAAEETRLSRLYYYGLLNVAKALAMARGRPSLVGKV